MSQVPYQLCYAARLALGLRCLRVEICTVNGGMTISVDANKLFSIFDLTCRNVEEELLHSPEHQGWPWQWQRH